MISQRLDKVSMKRKEEGKEDRNGGREARFIYSRAVDGPCERANFWRKGGMVAWRQRGNCDSLWVLG